MLVYGRVWVSILSVPLLFFTIFFVPPTDYVSVLICSMFSFFFISNSCHNISIETLKIGSFLYVDDYLQLAESRRFLSQIINQPIKITAKEFYQIDRSFFAAVSHYNNSFEWKRFWILLLYVFQSTVGAITSAIMLVQFQNN